MKRLAIVALLLACLLSGQAGAETVVQPPFLPQVGQQTKLPWFKYENQVYLYGFSLPGEFMPDDPQAREQELAEQKPGDADFLYDLQRWRSLDGRITFEFQLKKPTYASLEEEVEKLPDYLVLLKEQLAEQDIHDVRFSHEDVLLHETPVGAMLEVPVEFDIVSNTGHTFTVYSVYFDYYDANNEYIFYLQGIESSYQELADMLKLIAQTVQITPILLEGGGTST